MTRGGEQRSALRCPERDRAVRGQQPPRLGTTRPPLPVPLGTGGSGPPPPLLPLPPRSPGPARRCRSRGGRQGALRARGAERGAERGRSRAGGSGGSALRGLRAPDPLWPRPPQPLRAPQPHGFCLSAREKEMLRSRGDARGWEGGFCPCADLRGPGDVGVRRQRDGSICGI